MHELQPLPSDRKFVCRTQLNAIAFHLQAGANKRREKQTVVVFRRRNRTRSTAVPLRFFGQIECQLDEFVELIIDALDRRIELHRGCVLHQHLLNGEQA